MRQRITWLTVPLCWALACGGRFEQTGDGEGSGGVSTGQGGSNQSKAGTTAVGKGGVTSSGGSQPVGKGGGAAGSRPIGMGGSTAAGGVPGAGAASGAGAGGGCACDAFACAPGFLPVPNANGCCYQCELDVNICNAQRQDYVTFRDAIVSKYGTLNCQTDADCGLYFEKNACGTACPVAVINTALRELPSVLDSYAQMRCAPMCPPQPQPDCGPKVAPQCWKGYCE